jgi:hypothetical protein
MKEVILRPAMPIHWGKNQPGMQAYEDHEAPVGIMDEWTLPKEQAWRAASHSAAKHATAFADAGYHKQLVNRLTEPFQHISVVVTATEWDNFFELRLHPDAQPEFRALARAMWVEMGSSDPLELRPGAWHLPYITGADRDIRHPSVGWENAEQIEALIKVSAARCARVSYLNHDQSAPDVEKDLALYDRLVDAGHYSPLEHQATPMRFAQAGGEDWDEGVTHMDRNRMLWSANLKGWVQHRQLLEVE